MSDHNPSESILWTLIGLLLLGAILMAGTERIQSTKYEVQVESEITAEQRTMVYMGLCYQHEDIKTTTTEGNKVTIECNDGTIFFDIIPYETK